MKTIFQTLALAFISIYASAQAPAGFQYQAVIRDASGDPVAEQNVPMQMSILQGSADGVSVYTETFTPSTSESGVVSLQIGTGASSDDFNSVDWANGPFFIQTAIDLEGGNNFELMGTTQLMSVPFALFANQAAQLSQQDPTPEPVDSSDYFHEAIIPYMPYSPNASQILYCTNYSNTETRTINAWAFDDNGSTYDLGVIADVPPNTVKKLSSETNNALLAAGFSSGRVCIRYSFTEDIPNEFGSDLPVPVAVNELVFYASYNAGTVRGYVEVIYK